MVISNLANRATASTLFFTNLLRVNHSPPLVSATRPFSARIDFSVKREVPPNYPYHVWAKNKLEYLENLESSKHPLIRRGPPSPYFGLVTGGKIYVRIDMPGVGKEGLRIQAEKNYYVIEGVESGYKEGLRIPPEKSYYMNEGVESGYFENDEDIVGKRLYSAKMFFDRTSVMKNGITAVIENGVARIVFHLRSPPSVGPIHSKKGKESLDDLGRFEKCN